MRTNISTNAARATGGPRTMSGTDRQDSPWVLIQVRNQVFALQSRNVQTMLALPAITRLPSAPEFVRGLIDVRGRSLPLVDLRLRLGMEGRPAGGEAAVEVAVVVEGSRGDYAVAVDSVLAVEMLKDGSFEDLPEGVARMREHELVSGIAKREKDDDIVLLLDATGIIGGARRDEKETAASPETPERASSRETAAVS
jgi:purine-binding chemotaxis protein CheW